MEVLVKVAADGEGIDLEVSGQPDDVLKGLPQGCPPTLRHVGTEAAKDGIEVHICAMEKFHQLHMYHVSATPTRHLGDEARKLALVPPILPPGPVDQAERVVLRKVNRRAPGFISNLVRSRLIGRQVEVGQRIVAFQVAFTVPAGLVEVTDGTIIEFIE